VGELPGFKFPVMACGHEAAIITIHAALICREIWTHAREGCKNRNARAASK